VSGTSVVKGPHDELVHDTDEILPEDRVGEQVGNYRLEALLGEGPERGERGPGVFVVVPSMVPEHQRRPVAPFGRRVEPRQVDADREHG